MKSRFLFAASALVVLPLVGFVRHANAAREFSLADDKGANGIAFAMLDGLEPLHGTGNDVRGTIMLDEASPEKSSGKVIIGINALKVTSDIMTNNMKGEWCLDVAKFKEATFVVKSVKLNSNDKKLGVMKGEVTGDFTIKDVTKTLTAPVSVRYVAGGVKKRFGDRDGDLIIVSTDFSFNRFDFNIGKAVQSELLSDKVQVHLTCAGMAFKK